MDNHGFRLMPLESKAAPSIAASLEAADTFERFDLQAAGSHARGAPRFVEHPHGIDSAPGSAFAATFPKLRFSANRTSGS